MTNNAGENVTKGEEGLKDCPFCGCIASVERVDKHSFFVTCSVCDCTIPYDKDTYFTSEDGAITAWNRRATPKAKPKIPCSPGCQGHRSHPCEKCGQQWGTPKPEVNMDEVVELMVSAVKNKAVHVDSLRACLMLSAIESKYQLVKRGDESCQK